VTLDRSPLPARVPVLVTGASGGLGSALVERLLAEGQQCWQIRAMVRRLPDKPPPGVEYAVGDLGDPEAVERVVRGAAIVFLVGATMKGSWPDHQRGTIEGTRNVLGACRKDGVGKLIHVSSLSVIDWAGAEPFAPVNEETPLEGRAEARGFYTRAKLEAEKLVSDEAARGLPAVIVRPGQIFGGRIPLLTAAVARRMAGRFVVLGDGNVPLPLVYIDDVVDALLLAAKSGLAHGEIVQVVDPEVWTQYQVLAEVHGPSAKVVRIPRAALFAMGGASELMLGLVGKKSPLARYRLRSALAFRRFDGRRAEALLGWKPRVGVREGIRRYLSTTTT
jgi:nucleoside-diphosphate-sugar epimerase